MLTLQTRQLDGLELTAWNTWVDQHVQTLAELLPDIAAPYPADEWRLLVEGLLRRADAHDMLLEQESVAYCYGCLTLGLGFETRHAWARVALALRGPVRADALWDGIPQALDTGGLA